MFGLHQDFERLIKENKEIKVAIIGVGQMGRALVAQFTKLKAMKPIVIIDHKVERAITALTKAGIGSDEYQVVTTTQQADMAVSNGKIAICEDDTIATQCKYVEIVIDATGALESAAKIAVDAISNKKHILMMTVETDVTVGPLLNKKAKEAGVIFSGMAGDEPGAIMELYDFAKTMGLDVLVLGKGKNNPVVHEANPNTTKEEAITKEMNPRMLASFQDCTKTMVELVAVANATGLIPDCLGGHGATADTTNITDVLRLKTEGGILSKYGVVEYVKGVAPGVFAIVTTEDEEIAKELKYLSMGDGPNYLLYRPYHLCSLEVPITVGRMMLYGRPTIVPKDGPPSAEVVTVAKCDLKKNDMLDGIGGYTVYGSMLPYEDAKNKQALPIGLVNEQTQLTRDVAKGEVLTYGDVILDETSIMVILRKEQDEMFKTYQANG